MKKTIISFIFIFLLMSLSSCGNAIFDEIKFERDILYSVKHKGDYEISYDGSFLDEERSEKDKIIDVKIKVEEKGKTYEKNVEFNLLGKTKISSIFTNEIFASQTIINDLSIFKNEVLIDGELFNINYEFYDGSQKIDLNEELFNSDISKTYDIKVIISKDGRIISSFKVNKIIETTKAKYKEVFESLDIKDKINSDINYESEYYYKGRVYFIFISSINGRIMDGGTIKKEENDFNEKIFVTIMDDIDSYAFEKDVTIEGFHYEEKLKEYFDELDIKKEIKGENMQLPTRALGFLVEWKSSDEGVITNDGVLKDYTANKKVTFTAFVKTKDFEVKKEYDINIKGYTALELLEIASSEIFLDKAYVDKVMLPKISSYNILIEWETLNNRADNEGNILEYGDELLFEATLSLGDTKIKKEYKTLAVKVIEGEEMDKKHIIIERAPSFDENNMTNLKIENGKTVLEDGKNEGYYVSNIYECTHFNELVASFSCITSCDATCEMEVKIRVNSVWSKYYSYGQFGIARQNSTKDSNDDISYMKDDQIFSNEKADAFSFKITLRREKEESPVLSLVAITLNLDNYKYEVDTSHLPESFNIDVPKLCQNEVPVIGSVICSATSTAMLLKYKGMDFKDKDVYEHRYIASLVKDYQTGIYGNWVYNIAVMGGFGFDAYFQTMTSFDELKYHLVNVGPVAASVKGNTGLYTTAGHLLVVTGYKEENGKTYVICNDPNINSRFGADLYVTYDYPLETFMNIWRKNVYVIE